MSVDRPQPSVKPQPSVPTFEPLDLTAHLQPAEAQQTKTVAAPVVAEEVLVAAHTPATASQSSESQPTTAEAPPATSHPSIETEPEPDCQIIEVDGDDGFDFIDLKAFNIAYATFCPGKIFLDDGRTKFQILYRNLSLAVFEDDFQVELS